MAFEDITSDMFDSEVESVKEEEIAELPAESTDEGAKEQEVTEPVSEESSEETVQDDKTNSAFAEMRRAKEEAERKAQELEERIAQYESESDEEEEEVDYSDMAIDEMLDELDDEDIYEMIAEAKGISTNEVRRDIEAREEALKDKDEKAELISRIETLEAEKEAWEKEAAIHEADKTMATDLAEIQKFDPSVKSLADLPESFDHFRFAKTMDGGQMTATEAYFAARQMEEQTKVKPAQEIGKVNRTEAESEYYESYDEIFAMTSEERTKNADKIMRSLSRLK